MQLGFQNWPQTFIILDISPLVDTVSHCFQTEGGFLNVRDGRRTTGNQEEDET